MSSQKSQSLRRSQFIFTYGPGAILESKNGPRLIPSIRNGLKDFNNINFSDFEIEDDHLPQYLREYFSALLKAQEKEIKDGKKKEDEYRIFALPSNAALGKTDNEVVYRTQIFPRWHICYNTEKHEHPVLHDRERCPCCNKPFSEDHGTVRFILACPLGHMDDINWVEAAHRFRKHSCHPKYLYWIAKGSSLESITIQCPECGSQVNMKDIYNHDHKCKGRRPENELPRGKGDAYWTEPADDKKCFYEMQVVQRQSTSLRVADTVTMLTIPPSKSPIEKILSSPGVNEHIDTLIGLFGNEDKDTFIEKLMKYKVMDSRYRALIADFLEKNTLDELIKLSAAVQEQGTKTFTELLYDEFRSLKNSGDSPETSSTDNFRMESGREQDCKNRHLLLPFTLYPINLIRTVTVQTGYRRLVSSNTGSLTAYPIQVSARKGNVLWHPGFEGFGEALFLYFSSETLAKIHHGTAYVNWQEYISRISEHEKSAIYDQWGDFCHHPEFVWLHTLSHALIRATAEFTGYSAASIRERVYYSKEGDGGILLYNTTPGSDGGLGGLRDLADSFEEILMRTEETLRFCSNDPLCRNDTQDGTKPNGSACYSCLLIAETSCEHGNRWLDRSLFLEGNE